MSEAAALPELDDAAYQRVLATLVDVGTTIIEQLKHPSADIGPAARAKAFDIVALALRRTILLSRHIRDTARKPVDAERATIDIRRHVIRQVEDTIVTVVKDPDEADDLRRELIERMDTLEFAHDLARRPSSEVITELCHDLGLNKIPGLRAFPRRTPDDIAILCAQAAAPPGTLHRWTTPDH